VLIGGNCIGSKRGGIGSNKENEGDEIDTDTGNDDDDQDNDNAKHEHMSRPTYLINSATKFWTPSWVEINANAEVKAALKDDHSYDDDGDDDYFKNGAAIPIDGKVYMKKVSAKDKFQSQVKNLENVIAGEWTITANVLSFQTVLLWCWIWIRKSIITMTPLATANH
jgi:hypothetical protein